MSALAWTFLLFVLVLAADYAWTAFRIWWAQHLATKRGRTLTAKFSLPPP